MRPGLTSFKGWKVSNVEPGDHGWKITLVQHPAQGGGVGAIHTGHTVIEHGAISKVIGKIVQTVVMDEKNTQVYFGDVPIVFDALDYTMEYPGIDGPYNPQWPEEREAIGEMPPQLGEE